MSTMGMTDPAYAARLRRSIQEIVMDVIDRERPVRRYGVVTSIDTVSRTCQVEFPEQEGTSVTVRFGGARPSEVGQQVRVEGYDGDLWIAEVLGYTIYTGIPASQLLAVNLTAVAQGAGSLIPIWNHAFGYPEYKVQWAEDVNFTVNVVDTVTNARESHVITGLDSETEYWVRLAAGNGEGDFGPWGDAIGPTKPLALLTTDGFVPTGPSPQPVCTPGIRMITAEWVPLVNADEVYYEVYASTDTGFTPSSNEYIGKTFNSFFVVTQCWDHVGAQMIEVPTNKNTFVRLIALDGDGPADTGGAQGFATALSVDLGDVANVPYSPVTDSTIPSGSAPSLAGRLQPGPGWIYCSWDHASNPDQLTYELHISTTSGFTPTPSTLVYETTSNFGWIRKYNDNSPLDYTQTYYVRLAMKDADGYAAGGYGVQESTTVSRADENPVTVALNNALFGNMYVDEGQIANLAVTNAKIGNAAVDTAQIANLAVDTAQIKDLAVTDAKVGNLSAGKITADTMDAARIGAGTIGAHTITLSSGGTIQSATADWQILGNGDATFNNMTVNDGTITGGTITIGTAPNVFKVDGTGQMWLGAASFIDGPFRVTAGGAVTAENVTASGFTLTGTNNDISSGADVGLSGNLTVSTGGIIRSGSSGSARTEMHSGTISSGYGGSYPGVRFYNSSGTNYTFIKGVDSEIFMGMSLYNNAVVAVTGAGNVYINSNDTTIQADDVLALSGATTVEIGRQDNSSEMQFISGIATVTATTLVDLNCETIALGNNIEVKGNATNPGIRAGSGALRLQNAGGAKFGVEVDQTAAVRLANGDFKFTEGADPLMDVIAAGAGKAYISRNGTVALGINDNNEAMARCGSSGGNTNELRLTQAAGTLGTIQVYTSSERYKDQITYLRGEQALDLLHAVKPIQFRSTHEVDKDLDLLWGFSAENCAEAHPRLAGYDEDGNPQVMDRTALLAQLWTAVQAIDHRLSVLGG